MGSKYLCFNQKFTVELTNGDVMGDKATTTQRIAIAQSMDWYNISQKPIIRYPLLSPFNPA